MMARGSAILLVPAACSDANPDQPAGVSISGDITLSPNIQRAHNSELYIVLAPEHRSFQELACAESVDWDPAADVHWQQVRTMMPSDTFPITYGTHSKPKFARARIYAVLVPEGAEHRDRITNRRPPVAQGTLIGTSSVAEFAACTLDTRTPCFADSITLLNIELRQPTPACSP